MSFTVSLVTLESEIKELEMSLANNEKMLTDEEARKLECPEENKLTTHQLAAILLKLPDTPISYEDHTDTWSEQLIEGVQVGIHSF